MTLTPDPRPGLVILTSVTCPCLSLRGQFPSSPLDALPYGTPRSSPPGCLLTTGGASALVLGKAAPHLRREGTSSVDWSPLRRSGRRKGDHPQMGRLFSRNRLPLSDPAHQNFHQIDCPRVQGVDSRVSNERSHHHTGCARHTQTILQYLAQESSLHLFRIRSGFAGSAPMTIAILREYNVCASPTCLPEFAETFRQSLPGAAQTCALSATGVPSRMHIVHPFVYFVQDRHKGRARPRWEAGRVP